jgi:hypothetical protein
MSKKDDVYVQCELRRVNGAVEVSWIPERFAFEGHYVRLKNARGEWENGWQVRKAYDRRRFSEIELKERDHLRQRSASDV